MYKPHPQEAEIIKYFQMYLQYGPAKFTKLLAGLKSSFKQVHEQVFLDILWGNMNRYWHLNNALELEALRREEIISPQEIVDLIKESEQIQGSFKSLPWTSINADSGGMVWSATHAEPL